MCVCAPEDAHTDSILHLSTSERQSTIEVYSLFSRVFFNIPQDEPIHRPNDMMPPTGILFRHACNHEFYYRDAFTTPRFPQEYLQAKTEPVFLERYSFLFFPSVVCSARPSVTLRDAVKTCVGLLVCGDKKSCVLLLARTFFFSWMTAHHPGLNHAITTNIGQPRR